VAVGTGKKRIKMKVCVRASECVSEIEKERGANNCRINIIIWIQRE
jgi:hypothetical protein